MYYIATICTTIGDLLCTTNNERKMKKELFIKFIIEKKLKIQQRRRKINILKLKEVAVIRSLMIAYATI